MKFPAIALAIAFLAFFAGCATYRHTAYRHEAAKVPYPKFDLHFVEADDEGWLWSPQQALDAVDAVKRSSNAANTNTFVLLFIHGWYHSAECCDGNVEALKETLDRLHAELMQPEYRESRGEAAKSAGPQRQFKLIGIYVGWRGRSLPAFLNYFTFWGRKSAAERIGETDIREFIARLNDVYVAHTANENRETFLGLISIGHSFGAQVLLRATAATLEEKLEHLNPQPGYLRQPDPATPPAAPVELKGIGDLVILVNPATEAAAYQRLHLLSMGVRYTERQTPVMLTISAEDDRPRHSLFSVGRVLGELFTGKPRKSDERQREMERQALGVFGKDGRQVTHRIEPADSNVKLVTERLSHVPEPACDGRRTECGCDWGRWEKGEQWRPVPDTLSADEPADLSMQTLAAFDFSRRIVLGNVVLEPVTGDIPYQPLIVAEADETVIEGHSGIFTDPFLQFLIPYIGFIESKIYLHTVARKSRERTK